MLKRIRARLTYAKVTATVVFLAVAGSAMVAKNLIDGRSSANSVVATTTWFLAGSSDELPSCTSCEASLPASGTGSFGSLQNSSNEQLSPNATIVASDLSVHVDTAPGGVATRTFVLFSHADASHGLKCTISGSNTTCNSGTQSLTIPPGSRLVVDAIDARGAPTRVQLSWRATTQ